MEVTRQEDLDAAELIKMQETKTRKRRSIREFGTRLAEANQDQKVKTTIISIRIAPTALRL